MDENQPSQDVLLLDESYVKVYYDPEKLIGKVIWSGNPKGEEYKVPFEKLLEHGKTHLVKRFLSDTRQQGVVSVENRKWFEKVMVPAAIEVGMERVAVITDGNAFKRYYLNLILGAINKFNVPMKLVGDEEAAVRFLMEA